MELSLKQKQLLTQQQLQSIEILQLSTLELSQYLQALAMENPVIDLEEPPHEPLSPDPDILHRLQWLEDNDHQNRYYLRGEEDTLDPFYQVGHSGGLEESLTSFLLRQLERMDLNKATADLVHYLILCLDDDGYFRISLSELAQELRVSLSALAGALNILRSMEPAGVGAENLAQCLHLQLVRARYSGPALEVVLHHLDDLSRHHYREIAGKLSVSVEQIHQARRVIQDLEPRPGSIFSGLEHVAFILPDIYVTQENGRFIASARQTPSNNFRINGYYQQMFSLSTDPETKDYLHQKLRQAEQVLQAMKRRESTIMRCAQAIVDHQQAFFRSGPKALAPLYMSRIAQQLQLHDSTVSRTIREKYLQCAHGVFPLRYFFVNSAVQTQHPDQTTSATAAKTLLEQLIAQEDPAHPLSDQKIAQQLARQGCPVSRRTVAKYRDELNIPGTFGRKIQD